MARFQRWGRGCRNIRAFGLSWYGLRRVRVTMGYFRVAQAQAVKLAAESWFKEQAYCGHAI